MSKVEFFFYEPVWALAASKNNLYLIAECHNGYMAKRKTKTTKHARSCIQGHIRKHVDDGMDQKRAAAYSEASKKAIVFLGENMDT